MTNLASGALAVVTLVVAAAWAMKGAGALEWTDDDDDAPDRATPRTVARYRASGGGTAGATQGDDR